MTYQLLPPLTDDEYAALKKDIKEHGVQIPVIVDELGYVIDGHHRKKIAEELGIPCPSRTVRGTPAQHRSMALRLNVHRRSLTAEQKRELLAASITADPQLSDRQHAQRIGVSHVTAGAARERLESGGQIVHLEERTGSDGKSYPTMQPIKVTETTKVETYVDGVTGEIIAPPVPGPADAIAEAMRRPSVVIGKTIERLETVILGFQDVTVDEAIADIPDGHHLNADGWLATLDIAIPLLEEFRSGLRRRNLRSVK